MNKIVTRTALGEMGGDIFVFSDLIGERSPLKNERHDESHPFIQFANSQNLPELMSSLDELFALYGSLDLISDLGGAARPNSIGPEQAGRICGLFQQNPTRTTLERTRDAINAWSFDKSRPSESAQMNMDCGSPQLFICTPLEDIIRAKDDLRRVSLVMAWLLDKTSFAVAHGQEPGDKTRTIPFLDLQSDTLLSSYYKRLSQNSGNEFVSLGLHCEVGQMHLYKPDAIESAAAQYVRSAFNLLLSAETKKMSYYLEPYTSNNSILSAAWSFFADGLNKEGPGSIAICKKCGRFYTQQRQTKRYCSDSCRVMAGRPGTKLVDETPKTNFNKQRKKRQKHQTTSAV